MSTILFLRDVARRPLEMGAVLPSGNALAEAMVTEAQIVPGHVVLELGAGSGSFTRAIVARNPDNRLYLVEPGEDLAGRLQVTFPGAIVQARRAEELREMADELNMPPVDRVVSGLPWALWGWDRQAAILDALLPLLSPHARLVTFHYVHSRMLGAVATTRALLEARFRSVTRSAPVWSNVPPAYVHIAEGPVHPC